MKSIYYSTWDGAQDSFSLKRKEVIEKFMDNILKGMSPDMSLAQMLWEGFPMQGMDFRVMGLEEIFQELEKKMNELFSTYSLEKAFDKPLDAIKNLLSEEAKTREERGAERPPSFEELPPGLVEKLKSLDHFPFKNRHSRKEVDSWKAREEEILELFDFYSQYGQQFQGDQYLDFEEALELMRQFKSMEKLQNQILSGQFEQIDPETLEKLLGEEASDSLAILIQLPSILTDEGIVSSDGKDFDLTPRGMRSLGELAFGKLYEHVKRDREGEHLGNAPQGGELEPDSSRPYRFGDRLDLDITRTIFKSISRQTGVGQKLHLSHEDFYVREREPLVNLTTVMLLDLSWSMSWEGRFPAGKKVALALNHYLSTRFPRDKFHIIGFSTEARELKGKDLALAVWDAQQPFTNLQGGLRLAMKLIKRSGNRNNRVIVITDGQPTAYYEKDHLHVELPNRMFGISPNACKATLGEVRRVTAQGMNLDIFMLDDNPALVEFNREISRINGGRAIICLPGELGGVIMVEEIKRRGGKK